MSKLFKYSQNFLVNESVLRRLIGICDFKSTDIILDIGAGMGIITDILKSHSRRVICIEPDVSLFKNLDEKFRLEKSVNVVGVSFEEFLLPQDNFKVFSNIPFNRTAIILKGLLENNYFSQGYLILQIEAAEKYGGEQLGVPNSLVSSIYGSIYEFKIIYKFNSSDFNPKPNVNIVLLRIQKRKSSLIDFDKLGLYKDFIYYIFNNSNPNISKLKIFTKPQLFRFKKDIGLNDKSIPSKITLAQLSDIFKVISVTDKINLFQGACQRAKKTENKIEKVFRTRIDKNWRYK